MDFAELEAVAEDRRPWSDAEKVGEEGEVEMARGQVETLVGLIGAMKREIRTVEGQAGMTIEAEIRTVEGQTGTTVGG